jgi:membrane-bound lytic murein transglycosylase B
LKHYSAFFAAFCVLSPVCAHGASISHLGAQTNNVPQAQRPAPKPTQRPANKPAPRPKLPAFSDNPDVAAFIVRMASNYEFDANILKTQFAKIQPNQRVLNLFNPPPSKPPTKSWKKYSSTFLNEVRIEGGLTFWRENADALERAHAQFGVPPEIIVSIIGVETMFGQRKGTFGVMEALASLAFHSPRRSDFFMSELEHFLVLTRGNGLDPLNTLGSYAGAIGIPQFMPGSWRKYAVDFDGDGKIDLENNVEDSIGSVGNYLKEHGWAKDEPVAHRVALSGKPKEEWLKAGMLPSLNVKELAEQGVKVSPGSPETATFIELASPNHPTEYWLGYKNYYAITRYNRSTFYSMSVFMLAEAIKARYSQPPS